MKILIADDDELVQRLLQEVLQSEGFETIVCGDGAAAIELAKTEEPDLIILDIMMPVLDGFHASRSLQKLGVPIIMLTGKSDISDKLMGLEAGADDYIVKPFDSRELVARIRSMFRRIEKLKGNKESDGMDRGIYVQDVSKEVFVNGQAVTLTPTEYQLLALFAGNPERVFSRDQLLDRVWGYDYIGDSRTVDMHIQRLRKKLGDLGSCVETVFGLGYRFREKWK